MWFFLDHILGDSHRHFDTTAHIQSMKQGFLKCLLRYSNQCFLRNKKLFFEDDIGMQTFSAQLLLVDVCVF